MTATTTKIIQTFATVVQIMNAVNVAGLPPKWQFAFTGVLSILQAAQGIAAHYYTPAGTKITS